MLVDLHDSAFMHHDFYGTKPDSFEYRNYVLSNFLVLAGIHIFDIDLIIHGAPKLNQYD